MDLRSYYRKLREVEATIPEEHVVLVSIATPEGGKAGVRTEAPKAIAAKLIAENRARLANAEEAEEFRSAMRLAKEKFDQEEAARRMQVVVIPADARKVKERS
jgi:hypothetical protein